MRRSTSEPDERSGGSTTLVDAASTPYPDVSAAAAKARWWSRARAQIVRRHSVPVEIGVMVCLYGV